jgi:hypothetical protein
MKYFWLLGLAYLALAGCATASRQGLMADKVDNTREAVRDTDRLLTTTQSELNDFSRVLDRLKRRPDRNDSIQNGARYQSTLDRLQVAVQKAQLELQELQAHNSDSWLRFKRRVNRAVDPGRPYEDDYPEQSTYQAD